MGITLWGLIKVITIIYNCIYLHAVTHYYTFLGVHAKEYEVSIKHPLFPDNAFLYAIPQFPFSTGFPSDELHFLILGVFGDHLMGSIVHLWVLITRCYTLLHIYSDDLLNRYEQTLRPESLRNGGRHLLSDSKLATFWRRLETRLCSLKAEESMVTITPAMASHIHAMHVKKEISRKLTGDRTKILMLTMPFICRDLAYEEVWC